MMITGCEWLDVFVDQQRQIRRGTRKFGYWLLDVAQAGTYEFEMRRWPKELNLPLMDPSPEGGVALPITTARLFINNFHHLDIADKPPYRFEGLVKKVTAGDTHATFTIDLDKGPMALHTWFDDAYRETIASAYYVYVTRQ